MSGFVESVEVEEGVGGGLVDEEERGSFPRTDLLMLGLNLSIGSGT